MIADYTNPHGREIEPIDIQEIETSKLYYRVVRINGVYCVQYTSVNIASWVDIIDELYEKPAKYPTLHEAENFICRHRKPEIHYYY